MTKSIAAIHVAKKAFGWDDYTYRAKLVKIVGKPSTAAMTEGERQRVLEVFRNEGFQPKPNNRRADGRVKLSGTYAKKLQALWISGWNLGIIKNRDDAALIKFVHGRTGLDHTQFLHKHADAEKAIEALKSWLARDGGVDWQDDSRSAEFKQSHGYKIALAQFQKLKPGIPSSEFWESINNFVERWEGNRTVLESEWIEIMNRLGNLIREPTKGVADGRL